MKAHGKFDPTALEAARRVHRALGDENRLLIAKRIAQNPCTVSELILDTGIAGPLISWHLRKLRGSGLITQIKQGRETLCSFNYSVIAAAHALMLEQLGIDDDGAWVPPTTILDEALKNFPFNQAD
jgi:DNA-binding transcriptional ArsR family regulator